MILTKEWLIKENACEEAIAWFVAQPERDAFLACRAAMSEGHYSWVNWFILKLMISYYDYMSYAIFAADKVYESSDDKTDFDLSLIQAAKANLLDNNLIEENKEFNKQYILTSKLADPRKDKEQEHYTQLICASINESKDFAFFSSSAAISLLDKQDIEDILNFGITIINI